MSEKFEAFWAAWPKHPRKASKSVCLAKWKAKKLDAQAEHIIKHVNWLKTQDMWTKDGGAYIPAPLVYINQARWDGAEIPEPGVPQQAQTGVTHAVTIPVTSFKDPVLQKLEQDRARAVPMPQHIREKLEQLRRTPLTV